METDTTPSIFAEFPDDAPDVVAEPAEPETKGQQLALLQWIGLETETMRR